MLLFVSVGSCSPFILCKALQRSLWLNRMYASCFKPAMRNIQSLPNGASKDVDTDLALLMSGQSSLFFPSLSCALMAPCIVSGGVLPRSALSVSVQRTAGCLQLSLPLPHLSERIEPLKCSLSRSRLYALLHRNPTSTLSSRSCLAQTSPEKTSISK